MTQLPNKIDQPIPEMRDPEVDAAVATIRGMIARLEARDLRFAFREERAENKAQRAALRLALECLYDHATPPGGA